MRSALVLVLALAPGCALSHLLPPGDAGALPQDGGVPDDAPPQGRGFVLVDEFPAPRAVTAAAFDPRRRELVVHGGETGEAWALPIDDAPRAMWRRVGEEGPLSARTPLAAIDADGDRMLVIDEALRVHALDLERGAWSSLEIAGATPAIVDMRVGAFDAARRRWIVLGGGTAPATFALVLEESGARWERIADPPSVGPSAYWIQHALVLDARRDRLLLTGAHGLPAHARTYALALEGGTRWEDVGPGSVLDGPTAWIDPIADRAYAFHGDRLVVLALDAIEAGWQRAGEVRLPRGAAVAIEPDRAALFFGGVLVREQGAATNAASAIAFGALEPSALSARVDTFLGTLGDTAVWETEHARVVHISANEPYSRPATHARGVAPLSVWEELEPPSPGWRWAPASEDPERGRVLRFGGHSYLETDATFELDGTRWTELAIDGEKPAARAFHASVFDPLGDRLLVMFGASRVLYDGTTSYDDVWALSGSAWRRLEPSGARPAARVRPMAGLDERDGRVIVLGGSAWESRPATFGDAWALVLDPPRWERIEAAGSAPPNLRGGAWDERSRRFVVAYERDDRLVAAALDLSAEPRWRRFCDVGLRVRIQDSTSNLVIDTPFGVAMVTAQGGALVRFDPDTPYCD